MKRPIVNGGVLVLSICMSAYTFAQVGYSDAKAQLGELIFNDRSLSKDGTQSCSSCHDSNHAFIDRRKNLEQAKLVSNAVSLGQDGKSLGDINTPSVAYAAYVPEFHFDENEQLYIGGLFFDGRANNLSKQAQQPFINPIEMQTTPDTVVNKVRQLYGDTLIQLYGQNVFENTETAFLAIADSIAAFEKSNQVSPFNSRFDRMLKGEVVFTPQEKRGLDIFEKEDKGNCAACHPVPSRQSSQTESVFTDFTYDNLGVPANNLVRVLNQKGENYVDFGLYNNPEVTDESLKGAFRVSSLRNIAVTAPYMHNGVFKDLRTVVAFYNSRDVEGALNPETKQPWREAEVEGTKNTEELGDLGLSDQEMDDLVAFLKTLTDKKYEHLLVQ